MPAVLARLVLICKRTGWPLPRLTLRGDYAYFVRASARGDDPYRLLVVVRWSQDFSDPSRERRDVRRGVTVDCLRVTRRQDGRTAWTRTTLYPEGATALAVKLYKALKAVLAELDRPAEPDDVPRGVKFGLPTGRRQRHLTRGRVNRRSGLFYF
jgi:hypothetical protein